MTCEEVRLSLGAHALGALEPDEAVEVDNHLAECDACLEEFTGLAMLPPMLAKVSEKDIALVAEPPRQVLERLLTTTARKKQRGRLLLGLAASVAVLAVGGTVWGSLATGGGGTTAAREQAAPAAATAAPSTLGYGAAESNEDSASASKRSAKDAASPEVGVMMAPMRFEGSSGDVRAEATAVEEDGGTKLTVTVSGVPRSTSCQLIVVDHEGHEDFTAVWVLDPEYPDKASFDRVTSTPLGQIASLKLVDADRKVLAELKPA
ncbi:MAG: zf-HC2 domain-containing protein [Thermoactinospora sp.]|nr:zf-HC2 domain-containing protein [Thermoactinospora sp.]